MSGELPDEFWTKEFYSAADIGLKAMGRLSKAERNYLRRKILEEQSGNDEGE